MTTRLAGLIVLVAVIAATLVCIVISFRGEAANDRPAGPVSQHARERAIAEGDDASLEPPHLSVLLSTAFTERQADSDTEVAEQPRHLFAGYRIGAHRLDPLNDAEGLLDFGVDVERGRAIRCASLDLAKGLLLIGKFCTKVAQSRVHHGPDLRVLSLEDSPRGLFYLLSESLDLRMNLGPQGVFWRFGL